jgi:acyl carrier protein
MSNDEILAAVIELADSTEGAVKQHDSGAATPLSDGGFSLDSLGLIELLMACEDRFGIGLDASELQPQQLSTAGSLAAFIQTRLADAPSPS